jgi:phosphoketolase
MIARYTASLVTAQPLVPLLVSPMNKPLSPIDLSNIDGYWRASNQISLDQIYRLENPPRTNQVVSHG